MPDEVGTRLDEGETGQAEPDWPALADWLLDANKVAFFASKIEIQARSTRMTAYGYSENATFRHLNCIQHLA
ncbi:hypothetical protein LH53_06670 [Mesotoga sp. TolDC]|nr:hypothetical protein LH53_06670 [Mesotoga sp. TolDC]